MPEAEVKLRRAVELEPSNPGYLADLGTILAMQKKLEESTAFFTKSLKIDPSDLTARRYLAANLWQLQRPAEAKRNLELVLKATPDDPYSVFLLGMISEQLHDYATATRLLSGVPDLVRQKPESIAALARSYYHTAETNKAQETLKGLLDHPGDPQGVFLGARIAAEMHDFDTAAKLYEAIRSTYPDRSALGYNIALAQYNAQHFADAQQTLLDFLGAGYRSAEIYNLLGWCYEKQNRTREAVDAFDDAINQEPSKEQNYLDLAEVLLGARLFHAALMATERAVSVDPNSHGAFLLKGESELGLRQFTDAVASYSRAALLDPSDPEANLGVAVSQSATGRTEAARASFEEGVHRFPDHARHHLEYGLMLLELAEGESNPAKEQAEAQLKLALALDHHLSEADYQLGKLALDGGRFNEGLQYLRAADELDPGKTKIHFSLARAYRHLGRQEDVAKEMALYQKLKHEEEQSASALSPAGVGHDGHD